MEQQKKQVQKVEKSKIKNKEQLLKELKEKFNSKVILK